MATGAVLRLDAHNLSKPGEAVFFAPAAASDWAGAPSAHPSFAFCVQQAPPYYCPQGCAARTAWVLVAPRLIGFVGCWIVPGLCEQFSAHPEQNGTRRERTQRCKP